MAAAEVAQRVSSRSVAFVSELHPHPVVVGGLGAPCWHMELVPEEPSAGLGAAGPGRLWTALPGSALPRAPSHWPLWLFGVESGLFPGEGPSQQLACPVSRAPSPHSVGLVASACPACGATRTALGRSLGAGTGPHHTRVHTCSYMLTPRSCTHVLNTHECWSLPGERPARTFYT